ncbi:hypothetical protein ACQZ51_23185, partial [Agrobacterium sp. CG674]
AANCAISTATSGSPALFITVLNLNRPAASTAQIIPSADNLILPQGMADHRVDIDAVENPMKLFCRQRHHRHLAARPSELVFGQPFQNQHKTGSIKKQELHPVTPSIAKCKDSRSERIERHCLLDQDRKAIDPALKSIGSRCR